MRHAIAALAALLLFPWAVTAADRQIVNTGSYPGDGTGDTPRTAFGKLNANDLELFARSAKIGTNGLPSTANAAAWRNALDLGAPINVKWYGATGDGETDDRDNIQEALDAAAAAKRAVMFPDGTYRVSSGLELASDMHVIGSPGSIIKQTDENMNGRIFYATDASNITLDGLTIDGNEDDSSAGIENYGGLVDFRSCTNFKILNCDLYHARARAIDIRNCSNFIVSGCYWHDTGINKGVDGAVIEDSNGFQIVGNRGYNTGDDIFATIVSYGYPGAYDPEVSCYNYTVTGNTFDTCSDLLGGSIGLNGHDFTFTGNTVRFSDTGLTNTIDSGGIRLQPADVSVTSYRIRPYNVLIANNVINDSGSFGMLVEGANIRIIGNTITRSTKSGIRLYNVQDTSYDDAQGNDIPIGAIEVTGNNIIDNVDGVAGIHLYGAIPDGGGVIIQDNLISGNANGIYSFLSDGLTYSDVVITGNTISGNLDYGIHFAAESTNAVFSHLTLSGNTVRGNDRGIWLESTPDLYSIIANRAYDNTTSDAYWHNAKPPEFCPLSGGLLLGANNRSPFTRLEVVENATGEIEDTLTLSNLGLGTGTGSALLFRSRNVSDSFDVYSRIASEVTDGTAKNTRLTFETSKNGTIDPKIFVDEDGNLLWEVDGDGTIGSPTGGRPGSIYTAGNMYLPNEGYLYGANSDASLNFKLAGVNNANLIIFDPEARGAKFGKNITLAGTTNQVVFGATNTAPLNTAAPTKWISVQVTGESVTYRLPLFE